MAVRCESWLIGTDTRQTQPDTDRGQGQRTQRPDEAQHPEGRRVLCVWLRLFFHSPCLAPRSPSASDLKLANRKSQVAKSGPLRARRKRRARKHGCATKVCGLRGDHPGTGSGAYIGLEFAKEGRKSHGAEPTWSRPPRAPHLSESKEQRRVRRRHHRLRRGCFGSFRPVPFDGAAPHPIPRAPLSEQIGVEASIL